MRPEQAQGPAPAATAPRMVAAALRVVVAARGGGGPAGCGGGAAGGGGISNAWNKALVSAVLQVSNGDSESGVHATSRRFSLVLKFL
jgi:hypothetical protein